MFIPKILFFDVCGWCILIRCCDIGLSLSRRWVTTWAVVFVKASEAPSIVSAYGGFCVAVVHSVSDNNHGCVSWSWTVESVLVDYLILVVVLVPFVYFFDSIAIVYVHNMQCHVRLCCPFLHLDQHIVGLRRLCQSLYSGCPLSWQGEGIWLGSNLWLSRSSALRTWLRNPYRQSSRPCCPSYIYFLCGQRPLWWCFQVGQRSPLNFRYPTVVSPKLDLGAESLSSGCRGSLWDKSSVFRKWMCLVWNPPSTEICLGRASLGQAWRILLPSLDKWQVLVWRGSYRPYLRRWWTDWRHFQGRIFFCFITSRSDCRRIARS